MYLDFFVHYDIASRYNFKFVFFCLQMENINSIKENNFFSEKTKQMTQMKFIAL